MPLEDLKAGLKDAPKYQLKEKTNLTDLLVNANIASSKREAREFIKNNAIAINGEKVQDATLEIDESLAIGNEIIVIKRGRKHYYIIEVNV